MIYNVVNVRRHVRFRNRDTKTVARTAKELLQQQVKQQHLMELCLKKSRKSRSSFWLGGVSNSASEFNENGLQKGITFVVYFTR